ncbi:nitroreductase (plasmid) [Deinococcus sp. KNUC1210]|uniref:nitroreductase family protein n=1 Tax=Deinococcus sp. KNUC1210 TaxID=2917691 RepID=UPI001EF107E9|nr:nitroreductase [Deinococcus sp. KNUC1210]ULH17116.1 nitroreductase [Deinococcus sp. KNUC1210]
MPTLESAPTISPSERPNLDLFAAIHERRTVDLAHLRPDPLPNATLLTLLEAANWAPSHGQTEPWRFAVFTGEGRGLLATTLATSLALIKGQTEPDPETLRIEHERKRLAPVWLAVAVEPAEKPSMPLHEEQWAVACAVQTLMLAARSMGIGSKWISNPPSLHPNTARSLGFSERASMMGVLFLGYPAGEWPSGKRRPIADKVRWFGDEPGV